MDQILPTEEDEQSAFVEWLETCGYKFSALPLSTYTKSWKIKTRNKRVGVRAGVPDMIVIVKNRLVFIEMKRIKKGVISDAQKEWIEELKKCVGVLVYVCYGFENAKEVIEKIKQKIGT
jgi:hypothetical protein